MRRVVPWAVVLLCAAMPTAGCAAPAYNIRDFGAKGDRKTNDQTAIQAAVDACVKAGGGTVTAPPGDYLSGAIRLSSGVTLRLEQGATLWASTDPAHYAGKTSGHLLTAENAERIAVVGPGTINGQGTADYGDRWGAPDKPAFRTGILLFTGCRDVSIRDLTVLYSDAWTLHLKRCENVVIDGVTIKNNYRRLNSDGIDPNSCKNVRISNCNISAGDDCIVLKATEAFPCENVRVENCVLESAASALKLGTESFGDFRDISFTKCTIRNSPTGIGFYCKDGGTMERIRFSDITLETAPAVNRTVTPLFIDIEKRSADSKVGKVRQVTFENIAIRTGSGILLQGMPESPLEDITLRHITLRVDKPDDYAKRSKPVGGRRTTRDERDMCFARLPSYAAVAHVRNLTVENFKVEIADEAFKQYDRSALAGRRIEGGTVRGVTRKPGPQPGGQPVVDLQDCRQVAVSD